MLALAKGAIRKCLNQRRLHGPVRERTSAAILPTRMAREARLVRPSPSSATKSAAMRAWLARLNHLCGNRDLAPLWVHAEGGSAKEGRDASTGRAQKYV